MVSFDFPVSVVLLSQSLQFPKRLKPKDSFIFPFTTQIKLCLMDFALGNCKDCDKRTTEIGKSKETIREIIIHDNPPGIQNGRLLRSFCSSFYSCFGCFGGFAGFVSVFRWFRWFRFGVSLVSAVSVVSFRWFRFGVSGFSTCPTEIN